MERSYFSPGKGPFPVLNRDISTPSATSSLQLLPIIIIILSYTDFFPNRPAPPPHFLGFWGDPPFFPSPPSYLLFQAFSFFLSFSCSTLSFPGFFCCFFLKGGLFTSHLLPSLSPPPQLQGRKGFQDASVDPPFCFSPPNNQGLQGIERKVFTEAAIFREESRSCWASSGFASPPPPSLLSLFPPPPPVQREGGS